MPQETVLGVTVYVAVTAALVVLIKSPNTFVEASVCD